MTLKLTWSNTFPSDTFVEIQYSFTVPSQVLNLHRLLSIRTVGDKTVQSEMEENPAVSE